VSHTVRIIQSKEVRAAVCWNIQRRLKLVPHEYPKFRLQERYQLDVLLKFDHWTLETKHSTW